MNKEELYYDLAKIRKEEQEKSRQHFDMMSTAILAISGALIGAVAFSRHVFNGNSNIIFIAVLIWFVLCAISTIASLWPRKWYFNPDLPDLVKNIDNGKYKDESLFLWTANQISGVVPNNAKVLKQKAILLQMAYIFFALQALTIGILIMKII